MKNIYALEKMNESIIFPFMGKNQKWSGLSSNFKTEDDCFKYLAKLQPDSHCPKCKTKRKRIGKYLLCKKCKTQCSLLHVPFFQDTHLPLLTLFKAVSYITFQGDIVSASKLQQILGVASYRIAWNWLHKLQKAMADCDNASFSGEVEVNVIYLGKEKTIPVLVAFERKGEKSIGRLRLLDLKEVSLSKTDIKQIVNEGSMIVTDTVNSCDCLKNYDCKFVKGNISHCHEIEKLLEQKINNFFHGSIKPEHLQGYLNEFSFKKNNEEKAVQEKFKIVLQSIMREPPPQKSRISGKQVLMIKKRNTVVLTHKKKIAIEQLLINNYPDQLKIPSSLWTVDAVQQLFEQEGMNRSPASIIGHIKRNKLIPINFASFKRDFDYKNMGNTDTYKLILKRAMRENAEIHYLVDRELQINQESPQNTLRIIGTITRRKRIQFCFYRGQPTPNVQLDFLERLVKNENKKIILIIKNNQIIPAEKLYTWLEMMKNTIVIFQWKNFECSLFQNHNV